MEKSFNENTVGGAQANQTRLGVLNGNQGRRCRTEGERVLQGDRSPGGHNHATDPRQCEGQAERAPMAEEQQTGSLDIEAMVDQAIDPGQETQGETGRIPARGRMIRRKWDREKNEEVYRCYTLSKPEERGYRKRMLQIWEQRGNTIESEQRLCDQMKMIMKNEWLSAVEREEIRRKLNVVEQQPTEEPLEHQTLNQSNQVIEFEDHITIFEQNHTNRDHIEQGVVGNQEEENTTTFIGPLNYEETEKSEIKKKLEELMRQEKRERLPCLKTYKQWQVKEKVKKVDQVLGSIRTTTITETNDLMYAAALLVTTMFVSKKDGKKSNERKEPPWLKRLQLKREDDRKNVAVVQQMEKGNLKNKKKSVELEKRFKIRERGTKTVIEILTERIKATSAKIQRFRDRNEGYILNQTFQTHQKRVYSKLRESSNHQEQEIPDAKATKEFWENIWSNPATHNKNSKWLEELKREKDGKEKQENITITLEKVRKQLKKVPNWKAPGPDGVQGFWLKNFKSLHPRIAEQLHQCLEQQEAPTWITTGRTTLTQKDKAKGAAVTNYRPITCLPLMWKLLTGIMSEELFTFLERTNTIPREQKGCRRDCRGTKDQLLIDKTVMLNSKRRKTNLSMAWIDYKKAFDMVPHSWIIECMEMYGAAENITNFLKRTMINWKTILTASGTTLAEVNIRRGIFQGDSLSPLLFVLTMIPMTEVLNKTKNGYQLERGGETINHLMFMDDIKLYGKSPSDITSLVRTVAIITDDMKMEFGVQKCGVLHIHKGKVQHLEGIMLPDQQMVEEIEEGG